MAAALEDLPESVDALKAALLAERARATRVEAELAVAKAKASDDDALIAHQRLQIEKLTRQLYGQHSERTARLIDQMELAFEELESSASEDEIACQRRREDASAGRSKNASRTGVRGDGGLVRSGHPNSAFQFDQRACFPVPTWHHAGHGAQRRGWEERSHAQHREHGEHRTFPVVSTVAG